MSSKKAEDEKELSNALIVDRELFLLALKTLKLYYSMILSSYDQSQIDYESDPEIFEELREQLEVVGSIVNNLDASLNTLDKNHRNTLN